MLPDKIYAVYFSGTGTTKKTVTRIARRLDVAEGDYYELLIACLERAAQEQGIDPMAVYTDRQLLSLTGLI